MGLPTAYIFAEKAILTLCMLGNFACFFVVCGFFLKINFLGIPSQCQTVWTQIRPDVLSGLIWVQTVCKGYQQTTKVATSGERVNGYPQRIFLWRNKENIYQDNLESQHFAAFFEKQENIDFKTSLI